jgi:hypothetical protein
MLAEADENMYVHTHIHAYIQEERIRLKAMLPEADENMYTCIYIHTYRRREFT